MSNVKEIIADMLVENTGIAIMDSGGENGRMWQRNAGKTLSDFENEPEVYFEMPDEYVLRRDGDYIFAGTETECLTRLHEVCPQSWEWAQKHEGYTMEKQGNTSADISVTVSTFHYLSGVLELDSLCDEFNSIPAKDWDGEAYGVSTRGEKWLKKHGFSYGDSWNTYNGENLLSQVLQGTELEKDGSTGEYVLLQVHGGADVRGGYTDAKLFKYSAFQEVINPCPSVFATLKHADGSTVELDTTYNGWSLTDERGLDEPLQVGDTIEGNI